MTHAEKLLNDAKKHANKNADIWTDTINDLIAEFGEDDERLSMEDVVNIKRLAYEKYHLMIDHNITTDTYKRREAKYSSDTKKIKDDYGIELPQAFPFSNPSKLNQEINFILSSSLSERQIDAFKNQYSDEFLLFDEKKKPSQFSPISPTWEQMELYKQGKALLRSNGSGFGDDSRFDSIKATFKKINAVLTYHKLKTISIRQYFGLGGGIPEEYENGYDSMYEEASWRVDNVIDCFNHTFDIQLNPKEAAQFTNISIFDPYSYNFSEEGLGHVFEDIKNYKRTVKIIKLCFDVTPAKIETTISTLKALKLDIPMELEIAEDIRSDTKNAENKKRSLYETAIKHYFPFITDKKVIDKIYNRAMQ
jgi:hypothetical protein